MPVLSRKWLMFLQLLRFADRKHHSFKRRDSRAPTVLHLRYEARGGHPWDDVSHMADASRVKGDAWQKKKRGEGATFENASGRNPEQPYRAAAFDI